MNKPAKSKPEFDFESSMRELEGIVASLESGEIDLSAALQKFEQGSKIAAQLQDYLDQTELKINQIKADFDKKSI